jgi:hypothetical protein
MFVLYFDDSGTHAESAVAVAACYVASFDQWAKLESDWKRAQEDEGFDVFGMADILNGNGGFRLWPKEKRNRLIKRLITITRTRARIGFGVSVIKDEYDRIICDENLRGRFGKFHYTFAVRSCMVRLLKWRRHYKIAEPIRYVFDRMAHGKGEIEGLLDETIDRGFGVHFGLEVGGYSFRSKKGLPPLQAVDILAHEVYRTTIHEIVKPGSIPNTYMKNLHESPLDLKYWSVRGLEHIRDQNLKHFEELGYWFPPLTKAKGPKQRQG